MSMTKAQQARLADAIRRAAENQGIKQIDIARACGTSSGNFSYAMACKSPMSEEKWRLACEHVGVDYDAILAEGVRLDAQDAAPEEVRELPAEAVQMPITPPEKSEPVTLEVNTMAVSFNPEECAIIAHLIEAHLIEDIISKSGVRFEWLEKVMEIRTKCRRVAP